MSAVLNMIGGGGGGGSAQLNFSVEQYASAFPATASANTIGVITQAMTDWTLQANEPSSPSIGLVWIQLSTESMTPIQVVSDESVYAYPIKAKIFNGVSWEMLTAKCYQHGSWHSWGEVYYDNGTNYIEFIARGPNDTFRNNVTFGSDRITITKTNAMQISNDYFGVAKNNVTVPAGTLYITYSATRTFSVGFFNASTMGFIDGFNPSVSTAVKTESRAISGSVVGNSYMLAALVPTGNAYAYDIKIYKMWVE